MIIEIDHIKVDVRIEALMSVPRLGFTDNFSCWVKAFFPLGIPVTKGTGAYWGQVLQNLMERVIDEGKTDYILTVDYDTFFTREDVEKLVYLAVKHNCDAITGLQVRRDDGRVICQPPYLEARGETLFEVKSAHFGLTLIKCSSLEKVCKPWFYAVTNALGSWKDGHVDADISFWHGFRDEGFHVYVTPTVHLGHGEYMVLWPTGEPTFATDFHS